MLSKKYRIPKKLIVETIKRGYSLYVKNLGLKYSPSQLKEGVFFAFIIPKKVSKRAVVRNKLKRQTKAIIKNNLNKIKTGFNYVIMFKPGVNELSFQELEKEVVELFSKIKN